MRLMQAHRILIGASIALAVFFGALKLRAWREGRGQSELVVALVSFAIAGGFAVYLARLRTPRA